MIINAPCVPHTGHHFMMNRLFPDFKKVGALYECNVEEISKTIAKDVLIADHYHDQNIPAWTRALKRYDTFITIRHPARCYASHVLRNRSIDNKTRFYKQWLHMMEFHEHCKNPFYFHLDSLKIRIREAEHILSRTGQSHTVDWSVNRETGSRKNTEHMELSKNWLDAVPVEFSDFYFDTVNWSAEIMVKERAA